ncbi:hypothetical protein Sjap_020635 [Stephania japonica]|uniref:Uncharacterized protein n=1 Tax=Stephania japonica TaxID=461633 RepID=A0AAP0I0F9_9MAGN
MGIRFGAVLLVFAVIWHVVSEAEEKKQGVAKRAWNCFELTFRLIQFKKLKLMIQVLAKSGIPTSLLCVLIYVNRLEDICFNRNQSPLLTYLVGAIIGHYACCAGVTASSAIGTIGILINPRVPPVVTNSKGAVTLDGISIAALAGTVIGGTFSYITLFSFRCAFQDDLKQLLVTAIALVAGVVGFLIDSILVAVQEQRKRKLSEIELTTKVESYQALSGSAHN